MTPERTYIYDLVGEGLIIIIIFYLLLYIIYYLLFLFISESELSESETENERNFQFDFLIDGVYLQETLDKHLKIHNISTVSKFPQFNDTMNGNCNII